MRSTRSLVLLIGLLGLGACGGEELTQRSGKTASGLYEVSYVPSPSPIPFSTLFGLDVTVKDASGSPADNTALTIKVTMPAHGHGMQTKPEVVGKGAGVFSVTGMKFHMHGQWEIALTVTGSAGTDTITLVEDYE